MANYLVLKRAVIAGQDHLPNEMLVDPDGAEILMSRGFITPVPDDFKPTPLGGDASRTSESGGSDAGGSPTQDQTPPEADAEGEGDEPVTMDELMKLTRDDLDKLADKQGVEEPEGLPNKQAVAEAILEKTETPSE